MNIVKVRNIEIGTGKPKVVVPIIGTTKEEIINEAKSFENINLDIVEWRADWYEDILDIKKVNEVLIQLRNILKDTPILFTFRTFEEGGEKIISRNRYEEINKSVIESKLVDLLDVEMFIGDEIVKDIIGLANNKNIKIIISNHDFIKTPPKEEIISRLNKMQDMEADIVKIAVMPKHKLDVLELLQATVIINENNPRTPIITMSMSQDGMISRICGEIFGSCITFGCVNKSSAPGQINIEVLNNILDLIHENN